MFSSPLDQLPAEIMKSILKLQKSRDLFSCYKVSKKFRYFIENLTADDVLSIFENNTAEDVIHFIRWYCQTPSFKKIAESCQPSCMERYVENFSYEVPYYKHILVYALTKTDRLALVEINEDIFAQAVQTYVDENRGTDLAINLQIMALARKFHGINLSNIYNSREYDASGPSDNKHSNFNQLLNDLFSFHYLIQVRKNCKYLNLTGLNLIGLKCYAGNFSGANLSFTRLQINPPASTPTPHPIFNSLFTGELSFKHVYMKHAKIVNSDLGDNPVNFSHSNLENTLWLKCHFGIFNRMDKATKMSYSNLTNAQFNDCKSNGIDFTGTILTGLHILKSDVTFIATLEDATFIPHRMFKDCNLLKQYIASYQHALQIKSEDCKRLFWLAIAKNIISSIQQLKIPNDIAIKLINSALQTGVFKIVFEIYDPHSTNEKNEMPTVPDLSFLANAFNPDYDQFFGGRLLQSYKRDLEEESQLELLLKEKLSKQNLPKVGELFSTEMESEVPTKRRRLR